VPSGGDEAFEAFPRRAGEPPSRRVELRSMGISLELPDRPGWRIEARPQRTVAILHDETSSQLVIGMWSEIERMDPARCEERARALRELPERGDELAHDRLEVPAGFGTEVDVGMTARLPDAGYRGYLLAFGARDRRCFAFSYVTEAIGKSAERIVGARLATVERLTLARIRSAGGMPR
jgi:hypothetical protein